MKFGLLVILISIGTVSCSNQEVYNHFKRTNTYNCQKLPATQYDDCIKNNSLSHNEYEKERKKLDD